MKCSSSSTGFWFFLVGIFAFAERLWLYLVYRPVVYSDTHSYRRLAEAVARGWQAYDGTRTPGYPVFLAAFGADERVYLAQLTLGLLTTLLFFYMGLQLSRKGWFGALIAFAYTFNPQQLFFEANLITEALTTFLLALAFAGMAHLLCVRDRSARITWLPALGIGIAGGLAALTRPLFVFLPAWFALFLLLARAHFPLRTRWKMAILVAAGGATLLAFWVVFIHQRFGRWGLTTMTGYHLVQHTGVFFEFVPDEYAPLRDTYLRYRALRLAESGQSNNAIWKAIPEMQEASGLSFYDLSDVLAKLSLRLIWQHPVLYLRNVLEGWFWFWKAPIYWSPSSFTSAGWLAWVQGWVKVGHAGLMFVNLLFLVGSMTLLAPRVRAWLQGNLFLDCAVGAIWVTSCLQTLLDHGDNPRFAVPVQTLILLPVLWWSVRVLTLWLSKRSSRI